MDHASQSEATAVHVDPLDPIDPAAWDELQQLLGSEADSVLRELIDLYLEDAMRLVSSIVLAQQHKDRHTMIMAVHALRSPSASLGALRLASLGRQVEDGLRFDPQHWPHLLVDQMLIEVECVCLSLRYRRPSAL
jgi:HPt (histidine-containing phosphotransfer) domain-containing protein